jgi:hypothetical protein
MSSQNEISPLQFTTELKKIYNGGRKILISKNNWSQIDKLFEMAKIMIIPKPMVHGKKCSHCSHSMHCKSIKCPNCFEEQRKRKRQGLTQPSKCIHDTKANVNLCSLCHGKQDEEMNEIWEVIQEQGCFEISPINEGADNCFHKYCILCMIKQFENNVMGCSHCCVDAVESVSILGENYFSNLHANRERTTWTPKEQATFYKTEIENARERFRVRREKLAEEQRQMEDKEPRKKKKKDLASYFKNC